ncbi:hypothetical protein ASG73_06420 [Janibacter sp. Soil728]|uniref:GNAT family N-acetyltransferase n=1 Tax=Janibacter sp. Soil728 TaxID=1736393 RepID=UPI0006F47E5A|nr:GNAT family N-acetyltransferase [Janibacter sp. Soil728]KRE38554.1 hypothetical protein ASG73_06420 [Janibacter sp. Soil728]
MCDGTTPCTLPDGAALTVRPLEVTDAEAVVDLARADEIESLPEAMTELVDVQRSWRAPGTDLAARSLGLLDGDELVGYVVIGRHGRLDAVVSSSWRGRGLGRALLDWARASAFALDAVEVSQTVPVGSPAEAFLVAAGGRAEYDAWVLELPAERRLVDQPLPRGHTLDEGRPHEMRAVHRVIEDAFGEWPGRRSTSYEEWSADFLEGAEAASWRCRVVRGPQGAVVGVAMIIGSDDGMLWVDELAVAADRRGLGLARALLADSFAEGRSRGFARSGLSTDSRTGALGLYEHVGMEVVSTFRHYALDVDGPRQD